MRLLSDPQGCLLWVGSCGVGHAEQVAKVIEVGLGGSPLLKIDRFPFFDKFDWCHFDLCSVALGPSARFLCSEILRDSGNEVTL